MELCSRVHKRTYFGIQYCAVCAEEPQQLIVVIARHGETEYNRLRKMQGYQEIPLNDIGITQADRLARHLVTYKVKHIVCSDLRRAVMTGSIVAAHTGATMSYETGLRERDPGELTESMYEDSPRFFTDENYVPPGGEGVAVFRERVRDTFNRVAKTYAPRLDCLAVVTHGLVCRAFVREFFGEEEAAGVGAQNTSLTIARYESLAWHLDKAACVAHLADTPTITSPPGV
jgi:broad specificity phosphatase PhoE